MRVRFDRFNVISISALCRPTTRCLFLFAFAPWTASLQAMRVLFVSRDRQQLGVSLMDPERVLFCAAYEQDSNAADYHAAGSRPGRRIPFGGRQKESKTSLNVHAHRGMHKHSTRCVHLRATTPEILLHPCTRVETGVHGALCMAEVHASIPPWRCTCPCAVRPPCQGQGERFAFSECSVALVTARVHGWSSISRQCR